VKQIQLYIALAAVIGFVSFCVGYFFKKPASGYIIPSQITPSILLPTVIQPTARPTYTEESMLKCPAGTVKVCEVGMCDCQQTMY
jgi:hypothetical protein